MVDMTELEDLPNDIIPDLSVSSTDAQHAVEAAENFTPEGIYRIVLNKWEFARNRAGAIDFSRVKIVDAQIAEVFDEAHTKQLNRHVRYLTVWATPFRVGIGSDGKPITTSGLDRLIKGIIGDKDWGVPGDTKATMVRAAEVLNNAILERTPIKVKFTWTTFDKDYYEAIGGPGFDKGSPEQKDARNRSSIKGMQNFPSVAEGKFSPSVTGPSGADLEAELDMRVYSAK